MKRKYCWYVLKSTCISGTLSILCESVHRGYYIYNSLVHMIYVFIWIIYQQVTEAFLTLWSCVLSMQFKKPFKYYEKMFLMFFNVFEKIVLHNKYMKPMYCKKKNFYFFDVVKWSNFSFNFQYDHRLVLVEKWGTIEVARRCDWKNLLTLNCQDSIRFAIFQVA